MPNIKMKNWLNEWSNNDTAKEYSTILKGINERGGYWPEQVFSVDDTGLY